MTKVKTTPKDVFLYLLMMVMLFISVISLITVTFAYTDYWYPDELTYYLEGALSSIMYGSSMLLVSFPLFLFLAYLIQKDLRREPVKRDLKFSKWLTYITLFVAAITIVVDLIQLVYSFYGGELTLPFTIKVLAVLILASTVFSYFMWYTQHEPQKSKIPMTVGIVSALLVVFMLGLGFFIVGSPMKQRALRMDGRRLNNLQTIQSEIINYWQYKNELPVALDTLRNSITGFVPPVDPETSRPYEYIFIDPLKFKLCATFNEVSPYRLHGEEARTFSDGYYPKLYEGEMNNAWDHDAGRQCFSRIIDPALYPKPVK